VLATRDCVDGISDPRAYAFQTAKSLFLQNIRRSKIVAISTAIDLASVDIPADAPSPYQYAADRDDLRRVEEAIANMPPQTPRASAGAGIVAARGCPSHRPFRKYRGKTHRARHKDIDGAVWAWRKNTAPCISSRC
jgi:hypothetical protein